ncbi:hypothetical protein L211DRAFT_229583 [Terfezia boudieri ATCC MYA-4762]|uniref:Uncharacterized protein n=1 Tax=Terfezia boudieri ATCC MYA-4762 TaxID=1051890 RepID=A0A3N4LM61_9PEZI|nr:hypothetical protein L211DRAFT_229583 [Terfezia boudieri ATCC MYA-4762]
MPAVDVYLVAAGTVSNPRNEKQLTEILTQVSNFRRMIHTARYSNSIIGEYKQLPIKLKKGTFCSYPYRKITSSINTNWRKKTSEAKLKNFRINTNWRKKTSNWRKKTSNWRKITSSIKLKNFSFNTIELEKKDFENLQLQLRESNNKSLFTSGNLCTIAKDQGDRYSGHCLGTRILPRSEPDLL